MYSVDGNAYNRFTNLDNVEWNIIWHLVNSETKFADMIWKILKYDTEDCLLRDSVSRQDRINLIYTNNGDASVKRVFMTPYIDDAWDVQSSHLHVYVDTLTPRDHLASVLDVTFETIVHNKISNIIADGADGEKFGVEPGQLADYLALVGDASDNIPGVEGVGPKTAAALLNQFGSAEQMFSHLDEVKRETLRTRLAGEKEHFQRNRKLVLLDRKPPEGTLWKLEDLRRTEPDFDAIRDIADRMSLKSIRKEIDKLAGESGKTEEEDASLFSFHEPREPEAGKNAGKETGTMTQMDLFG